MYPLPSKGLPVKKSISIKKRRTIWIDRMGEEGRSLHFYNCTADRSMLVDKSVKESTVQSRIYHREMQCKSLQMQYRTRESLRNKLVFIYIGMYFIKVIYPSGMWAPGKQSYSFMCLVHKGWLNVWWLRKDFLHIQVYSTPWPLSYRLNWFSSIKREDQKQEKECTLQI